MRIRNFLFVFLFFPVSLLAQEEDIRFKIGGFIDTYHAVRSKKPSDFMSSRSRLRTELNLSKGKSYLFASLNSVNNHILEDQTGIELREAFFQYSDKNWDLKAGKQIIIWGIADGLRVTDLISPMDYSEFLARDYDDIRIPVSAFRLKYLKPSYNLELVFVPVPEFFILPVDVENPWSITASSTIPYQIDLAYTPDKKIRNSEYGGRFSFFLSGIDFSVSALHTWNKMPAFEYSFSAGQDTLNLQACYARLDMLGLDFSMPTGKFVIRGEIAEYFGELQEVDLQAENNKPLEKNTTNFLLGTDWYPGSEWTVTAQYSHKLIMDDDESIEDEKNTGLSTFGMTRNLFRRTLTVSTFTYIDLTNGGFFNRTGTDYSLTDQIHLMAGYDWFHGEKGNFGMYHNNSEYWVKAKFSF